MKVRFKCCLSGKVFYQKGDIVELEDEEATRLLERDIAEKLEEKDKQSKTQKNKEPNEELNEEPSEEAKKGKK